MKKVFIWWICADTGKPIGTVSPCEELGHNAFPTDLLYGELSKKDTEEERQNLIQLLKEEGELEKAEDIEMNTKVIEVAFKMV